MFWLNQLLLISLFLTSAADAAKILVFLPFNTWSHYMQYELLYETLADKGHEITVYSPFSPKRNITNFKHIYLNNFDYNADLANFNPIIQLREMHWFFMDALEYFKLSLDCNEGILTDTSLKRLKQSKESFDLVITESFLWQETTIVLGHFFSCPVINLNSNALHHFNWDNPHLPSFMPEAYSFLSDQMSFLERIQNLYYTIIRFVSRKMKFYYLDALIKTHLGPGIPPIESLLRNCSIIFTYTNSDLEYPYPKIPKIVDVGGIHLQEKNIPDLPKVKSSAISHQTFCGPYYVNTIKFFQDLKKILDDSREGFILFSLGTVVKPTTLLPELLKNITQAFSNVKFKVIWKWSGEPIKNLPENVVQREWIPQMKVLGHPNCKLFITHGGQSSQLEAIHFGVPVITIPYFDDQYRNAMKCKKFGFGEFLENANVTAESLKWAIQTVLSDPSYKQQAVKWSKIMRDTYMSPLDTAVYWVEYVLQHKGATHLTPVSKQLYWYQYYLLDVIGVLGILLFGVLVTVKWTMKKMFKTRKYLLKCLN